MTIGQQTEVWKRVQVWLPVILILAVVFYSSSQPYEKQDIRPLLATYLNMNEVTHWFSWVSFTYAKKEISIAHLGAAGFVEFFIRKAAHFGTNFVLGFFICRAFLVSFQIRTWMRVSLAAVAMILFAGLDETHQMMTPNRTPLLEDVLLDTVGGWTGIVSFLLIYWRYN